SGPRNQLFLDFLFPISYPPFLLIYLIPDYAQINFRILFNACLSMPVNIADIQGGYLTAEPVLPHF
ncbi:hypothetical protein, partial [Xenorhabdus littoralis]|uniref:hypothetical protein n=1 Tax=Xenorhabdus littoralis TaxID=2582835 RepID=UPI0029E7FDE2